MVHMEVVRSRLKRIPKKVKRQDGGNILDLVGQMRTAKICALILNF